MPLSLIITISLGVFAISVSTLVAVFYFRFRIDKLRHPERHEFVPPIFAPIKRSRSHKYVMNNFTKRIFFGKPAKNNRIKVINTYSPLETEKYSFK